MTQTEAIAAFFASRPDVNIVCTEFGHAYDTAKFSSTCKLTRTRIECGEAIRKIEIVTRAGTTHSLFVATRTFGTLFGANSHRVEHERGDKFDSIHTDLTFSTWTRFTGVEQIERFVRDADKSTKIEIVDEFGASKSYSLDWRGKWNGKQTTNALLSSLRRSKRLRLVRVSRNEQRTSGKFTHDVRVAIPLAA